MTRSDRAWPSRFGQILLAALVLLAWGGAQMQGNPTVGLRFVHLSPDAPLVDLIVDGTLRHKDIAYATVTAYLWLDAGPHEITVYPHRAPDAAKPADLLNLQTVLSSDAPAPSPLEPFTISVDTQEDRYYTVHLAGFFTPPSDAAGAGSLRLNLEPGTGVQISGPRSYLMSLDSGRTLKGLEPGLYTVSAAREGFEDVDYEVTVNAGQTASLDIALEATEVASDSESAGSAAPVWHRAQLYLHEDTYGGLAPPGQALIRVIHAAPGLDLLELASSPITPVDEPLDTAPATVFVEDLAFSNVTPYLSLTSGTQTLEVRLAKTGFRLATLPATILPGTLYTLYLGSSMAEQVLTPIPSVDAVLRAPLIK